MFTQIVVLYMAYQYNLPTWCKVFVILSMACKMVQFGMGLGEISSK